MDQIKNAAKKYFSDLGLIDQDEIDIDLYNEFLQNLKETPPKTTLIGRDFAQKHKTAVFDFMLFGSDAWYQPDSLSGNMLNIILDAGLKPDRMVEHSYETENAVGAYIATDTMFVYTAVHSYKKNFASYSPKHPLLFIVMSKKFIH